MTTRFFYTITGSRPSQLPAVPKPAREASPISPDQAMAIARTALPGATPFLVMMPGPEDAFQIRLRYPEDRTPGGRSRVLIDQYSGKLLFAEGSRNAPAGSRMVTLNRAIHTGDIFGLPSKFLTSLASLLPVVQLVSGVVMWRKRVKLRQKAIAASVRR